MVALVMPRVCRPTALIAGFVLVVAAGHGCAPDRNESVGTPPASTTASGENHMVDERDDLHDQDGFKAVGPPYVDIVELVVGTRGRDVRIALALAGEPPVGRSAHDEVLNYTLVLETTGDSRWDFWSVLQNTDDGTWSPSMIGWTSGEVGLGDDYPWSSVITGDTIVLAIPLADLGDPGVVRVCVATQQAGPGGRVLAQDSTPGEACLSESEWLTIAP